MSVAALAATAKAWPFEQARELKARIEKLEKAGRPKDAPVIFEFGRFRVVPHRRELLADGRPMKLGGREFDLLLALIEVPGAVICQKNLIGTWLIGALVDAARRSRRLTRRRVD